MRPPPQRGESEIHRPGRQRHRPIGVGGDDAGAARTRVLSLPSVDDRHRPAAQGKVQRDRQADHPGAENDDIDLAQRAPALSVAEDPSILRLPRRWRIPMPDSGRPPTGRFHRTCPTVRGVLRSRPVRAATARPPESRPAGISPRQEYTPSLKLDHHPPDFSDVLRPKTVRLLRSGPTACPSGSVER